MIKIRLILIVVSLLVSLSFCQAGTSGHDKKADAAQSRKKSTQKRSAKKAKAAYTEKAADTAKTADRAKKASAKQVNDIHRSGGSTKIPKKPSKPNPHPDAPGKKQ